MHLFSKFKSNARETCYYSPLTEVGVFSTEMKIFGEKDTINKHRRSDFIYPDVKYNKKTLTARKIRAGIVVQ